MADHLSPRGLTTSAPASGLQVTDVSALAGGVLWSVLLFLSRADVVVVTAVDLYIALALLVLVPLALRVIDQRRYGDVALPAARGLQGPAAVAAVIALTLRPGTLATGLVIPWVCVTLAAAAAGIRQVLERGHRSLSATAVDLGLVYLAIGGAFLFAYSAGGLPWFDPLTVALTVVHFHVAGFVLPVVVGSTGRLLDPSGRLPAAGRWTTGAILAGLPAVAIGIVVGPILEIPAVVLLSVAVIGFALIALGGVVPDLPPTARTLATIAWIAVIGGMVLALLVAASMLPGTPELVDRSTMLRWHGPLNGIGFALAGVLSLRFHGV